VDKKTLSYSPYFWTGPIKFRPLSKPDDVCEKEVDRARDLPNTKNWPGLSEVYDKIVILNVM
jgi:hypothetical protein